MVNSEWQSGFKLWKFLVYFCIYFVNEQGMRESKEINSSCEDIEQFAYKVLQYLWDDVAKFNRSSWFGDTKSLDDLVEKYKKIGVGVFVDDIFHK